MILPKVKDIESVLMHPGKVLSVNENTTVAEAAKKMTEYIKVFMIVSFQLWFIRLYDITISTIKLVKPPYFLAYADIYIDFFQWLTLLKTITLSAISGKNFPQTGKI